MNTMQTLLAIISGCAVIGLCYAAQWAWRSLGRYLASRRPDNKDLYAAVVR